MGGSSAVLLVFLFGIPARIQVALEHGHVASFGGTVYIYPSPSHLSHVLQASKGCSVFCHLNTTSRFKGFVFRSGRALEQTRRVSPASAASKCSARKPAPGACRSAVPWKNPKCVRKPRNGRIGRDFREERDTGE